MNSCTYHEQSRTKVRVGLAEGVALPRSDSLNYHVEHLDLISLICHEYLTRVPRPQFCFSREIQLLQTRRRPLGEELMRVGGTARDLLEASLLGEVLQ